MNDESLCERRSFLARSGLAVLAAGMASEASAQEWSEAEAANVEVVNRFCGAWSKLDLGQVTSLMANDSVYRMTENTPPITGHAALVEQMQPWVDTSDAITFSVLETFAKGPIVVNHRIDTFESTTRPLTWEGVGVFFVQEGKIKEWSDYTIRVDRG
jgi:limonene-1,2-epoxide hydrolase